MALSLLLWWIPVFFVTGVLIGVILQIVMPTYERGGMQILGLLALAVFTVVVVSVLTAVIRSIEPEPTADVGQRVRSRGPSAADAVRCRRARSEPDDQPGRAVAPAAWDTGGAEVLISASA